MNDHEVEQLIGRLLQLGVALAAAVTLAGAFFLLAQHGSTVADFSTFRGEPAHLSSIIGILRGVREMRSESIVQLGLVLLIATPVARVAFTLLAFILQRDRTYVAVTTLVLALLVFGLVSGRG